MKLMLYFGFQIVRNYSITFMNPKDEIESERGCELDWTSSVQIGLKILNNNSWYFK